MSDYFIGLAINAALAVLVAAIIVWRYRVTVAVPQQLRALQYRLFAVRDHAVHLVAEGTVSEDDPRFQKLYERINRSACSAMVGRFRSGMSFVLGLLRHAKPPSLEDQREFDSLPEPMKKLLVDYARAILSICWDGSWLLRTLARLALRFHSIKEWMKRRHPVETERYVGWQNFSHNHAHASS